MIFFKKIMLGYSNTKTKPSEGRSCHRCRKIPSSTTGLLSLISSTGDILLSPPNILASTAVGFPGSATVAQREAGFSDLNLKAEDGSKSRNSGETRALGQLDTKVDHTKVFELCDSLGFESSVERMHGGDLTFEPYHQTVMDEGSDSSSSSSSSSSSRLISRTRRTMSEGTLTRRNSTSSTSSNWENFPPLITSLNESGRSRYVLEKKRNDGRLVITMAKNEQPRVVRVRSAEKEPITRLVLVPDD